MASDKVVRHGGVGDGYPCRANRPLHPTSRPRVPNLSEATSAGPSARNALNYEAWEDAEDNVRTMRFKWQLLCNRAEFAPRVVARKREGRRAEFTKSIKLGWTGLCNVPHAELLCEVCGVIGPGQDERVAGPIHEKRLAARSTARAREYKPRDGRLSERPRSGLVARPSWRSPDRRHPKLKAVPPARPPPARCRHSILKAPNRSPRTSRRNAPGRNRKFQVVPAGTRM